MPHADEVEALWTSTLLFYLKLEEASHEGSLQVKVAAQAGEVRLRDSPSCCRHSSEQETKDKEFPDSFTKESLAWMRTAPEQVSEWHDDN